MARVSQLSDFGHVETGLQRTFGQAGQGRFPVGQLSRIEGDEGHTPPAECGHLVVQSGRL